jgi:hypothetical protein
MDKGNGIRRMNEKITRQGEGMGGEGSARLYERLLAPVNAIMRP